MTREQEDQILNLSDRDLVHVMALIPQHPKADRFLSDWERGFSEGVQEAWVEFGSLTWKQRRACRHIALKVYRRVTRAELDEVIQARASRD